MTTVDARYWPLAATAGARIVGHAPDPSVTRAIVAQWVCENATGGELAWPPPRNNPGNVARGFATGLGIAFTVATPNPQPANPIVTFATPTDGALCYAAGLSAYSRYAGAVAKAKAGDGLGFVLTVCGAGYGTNAACVNGVYKTISPPTPPAAPADNIVCRAPHGVNLRTGPGTRFPAVRTVPAHTTAHKLGWRIGQPYWSPWGPGLYWTSVDRIDGEPLGRILWTADRFWVNR